MNLQDKKIGKKTLVLIAIGVIALHFVLQMESLFLSLATGMAQFDDPSNVSAGNISTISGAIATILSFPIVLLFQHLFSPSLVESLVGDNIDPIMNLIGSILFILNSVLWGTAFYFAATGLQRKKDDKKKETK